MNRPVLAAALLCAVIHTSSCLKIGAFLDTGRQDTERIDRATATNPDNAHAWFLLGKSELSTGKAKRAERAFRHAARIQPDFQEAHAGIGMSLLEQRRFKAARDHYASLVELFPRSALGHEGVALAEFALGNLDAAVESATRATELDSESRQAWRTLGEVAYIRGQYADAVRHWERAMEDGVLAPALEGITRDLRQFVERYPEASE